MYPLKFSSGTIRFGGMPSDMAAVAKPDLPGSNPLGTDVYISSYIYIYYIQRSLSFLLPYSLLTACGS